MGAVFDDHDDSHGNFDADEEIALAAAAAGEFTCVMPMLCLQ